MKYDSQRPYAASFVILSNSKDQVAFVLRSNTGWLDGKYCLPAGKVEKNESYTQAAVREAKEEVGVVVEEKDMQHAITVHRNSGKQDGELMEWTDVYFEAKKYEGEPYNAEPEVHGELKWFALSELPENMVPYNEATLRAWQEGKTYLEDGYDELEN